MCVCVYIHIYTMYGYMLRILALKPKFKKAVKTTQVLEQFAHTKYNDTMLLFIKLPGYSHRWMGVGAAGKQPEASFLRERRFRALLPVLPSLKNRASKQWTLNTYF